MIATNLDYCKFTFLPVAVVQSLTHVHLFATPWTAAHQVSLTFTISQSLLKLMPIESVTPSNHLILCPPPLLLPSIFPSILTWLIFCTAAQSILRVGTEGGNGRLTETAT